MKFPFLQCGDSYSIIHIGLLGLSNYGVLSLQADLPVLGEKDKDDILNFGIPQGVNYIAASFVQSGKDVRRFVSRVSFTTHRWRMAQEVVRNKMTN